MYDLIEKLMMLQWKMLFVNQEWAKLLQEWGKFP